MAFVNFGHLLRNASVNCSIQQKERDRPVLVNGHKPMGAQVLGRERGKRNVLWGNI